MDGHKLISEWTIRIVLGMIVLMVITVITKCVAIL